MSESSRNPVVVLVIAALVLLAGAAGFEWRFLRAVPTPVSALGGTADGAVTSVPAGAGATVGNGSPGSATVGSNVTESPNTNVAPEEPPPPTVVTPAQAERQDAKITRGLSVRSEGGLLVTGVPKGSVVSELMLQPGDVILQINGNPVSTLDDFAASYREQGAPRSVEIQRDGRILHRH